MHQLWSHFHCTGLCKQNVMLEVGSWCIFNFLHCIHMKGMYDFNFLRLEQKVPLVGTNKTFFVPSSSVHRHRHSPHGIFLIHFFYRSCVFNLRTLFFNSWQYLVAGMGILSGEITNAFCARYVLHSKSVRI